MWAGLSVSWGPVLAAVRAVLVFLFQAEDGIRDWSVTVQTCALPISDERFEVAAVLLVESLTVHLGHRQSVLREFHGNLAVGLAVGEVACPRQPGVHDPRRAPA